METLLNIGAKLDKETADNASNAITQILQASYDFRMSDEVILRSLEVLKSSVTVQNISLNGCTFDNDERKTIELVVPTDFTVKESK